MDEFDRLFGSFEKSAFRLQLLPEYAVSDEDTEYRDFLAGEPLPERAGIPWLETMAGQVRRGRTWTNVHLLPERLTPYLRYLIDWWYVYHAHAGAEIRFLPYQYANEIQALAPQDFWLFDDTLVIHMRYGSAGEFLGVAEALAPQALHRAQAARNFALANSEDLRSMLSRRRAGELI